MSIPAPVSATPHADVSATTGDCAVEGAAAPAAAADGIAVLLFADVLRALGCPGDAADGQDSRTASHRLLPGDGAQSEDAAPEAASVDASGSEAVAADGPPADSLPLIGPAMASTPVPAGAQTAPVAGAAVPSRAPQATPRVDDGAAPTVREPARSATGAGPLAAETPAIGARRTVDEAASPAASATVAQGGAVAAPGNRAAAPGEHPVLRLANADTASAQWRGALQEALGDRLQLQLNRGSERALIRLDPPSLGRIEIAIRHEGGALQVHLNASNGDVLRQLAHIGDGLRQELSHRQYSDVQVVVGESGRDTDGRQRQPQRQARDEEPGRALAEADAGLHASAFALAPDRD